jgi:hypothetical protein
MQTNILNRLWNSTGGAGIAFVLYIFTVLTIELLKLNYFDMSKIVQYLVVPAGIFIPILPATEGIIGVQTSSLLISATVYVIIGYAIDFFYKPMK